MEGCNFFTWFDPPMCERLRELIPAFLQVRNEIEVEIRALRLMRNWIPGFTRFVVRFVFVLLLDFLYAIIITNQISFLAIPQK